MSNFEFAMKHRTAFNVYCKAAGICANPHSSTLTARFRTAVEKQLKEMRKNRAPCAKPAGYALIGKSTVTPPASVPTAPASINTFAIRETRKPTGLVFDSSNGIFI